MQTTDTTTQAASRVMKNGNGKQEEVRVVWTKRPVRLIERGSEVSEVQFLDTGHSQAIPNDQLEFFDDDAAYRRLHYGYSRDD
jgi:hypothetical protein